MKVSFPHMGNLYIVIASTLEMLGGEVIIPPYNSKKALSIGTRYSPEAVCLPYKLVLGNYIQAIENGAEALLMIDSPGICRLGQYSASTREALIDLGYDVEFINLDLYKNKLKEMYFGFWRATGNANPFELVNAVRLAILKVQLFDQLDKVLYYYRAREVYPGEADRYYNMGLKKIYKAYTVKDTKEAFQEAKYLIQRTVIDPERQVVNIDITGEIYVVIDQFSNLEIEKELGKLGVQVNRRVCLSNWINATITPAFLRKGETHEEIAHRNAKGYLSRDIGGDGLESVGDTSYAGDDNQIDGVIHLLPFTCMPEIVAQNILPNIRNEKDIPVLSLVLDEQMGKAGYITRLEAFVDLVKRKKYASKVSKTLISA